MLGFTLAWLSYLSISGSSPSSFRQLCLPRRMVPLPHRPLPHRHNLHLSTCLPAGFLMVWQFVPVIRHKLLLLFHRINGYLIISPRATQQRRHTDELLVVRLEAGLMSRRRLGCWLSSLRSRWGHAAYTISRGCRLINIELGCSAQCST